jgi:hypothetical protein
MKTCSMCKLEKDDVSHGKCTPCKKEYLKKYYKDNKERLSQKNAEYRKKYREENKDKIAKKDAEYRAKNKEKILARGRKYNRENKEWRKQYLEKNKDKIARQTLEYRQKHKDHLSKVKLEYYQKNKIQIIKRISAYYHKNKDLMSKRSSEYRLKNRTMILKSKSEYYENNKHRLLKKYHEYRKKRKENDINYKIKCNISGAINIYLKHNKSSKNNESTLKHLPYSMNQLKEHLERQFEHWMNWNNYGIYVKKKWDDNDITTWTWQIDHITPHSLFKYTSMDDEEFKKCWALENLRPLNSKQNCMDGANRTRHTSSAST